MRGGTTERGDGGNWLGVVKASEFTPEIIGGRVLEASKATKRMNTVFATALTCMTVSARKYSTSLYMIGVFKRHHARIFMLKKSISRIYRSFLNDDGVEIFQLEVSYGKEE